MLLCEFHAIEAFWKKCSVFAEFWTKKVARKLTVLEWWPIYFFSQNLFIKSVLAFGTLYSLIFCFLKVVYGIVFGVTPDIKIISFGVRRLKNRRVTPNREEILSVYHIQHCFLPPLRFHCVRGCWDRTKDCCDFGTGSQTLWPLEFYFSKVPIAVLRIWIRNPGSMPFWPLDPGSGMARKSASGSGIHDEQPGSYFLELRNHFFGLKYLNSLMRIRDPGWRQFG